MEYQYPKIWDDSRRVDTLIVGELDSVPGMLDAARNEALLEIRGLENPANKNAATGVVVGLALGSIAASIFYAGYRIGSAVSDAARQLERIADAVGQIAATIERVEDRLSELVDLVAALPAQFQEALTEVEAKKAIAAIRTSQDRLRDWSRNDAYYRANLSAVQYETDRLQESANLVWQLRGPAALAVFANAAATYVNHNAQVHRILFQSGKPSLNPYESSVHLNARRQFAALDAEYIAYKQRWRGTYDSLPQPAGTSEDGDTYRFGSPGFTRAPTMFQSGYYEPKPENRDLVAAQALRQDGSLMPVPLLKQMAHFKGNSGGVAPFMRFFPLDYFSDPKKFPSTFWEVNTSQAHGVQRVFEPHLRKLPSGVSKYTEMYAVFGQAFRGYELIREKVRETLEVDPADWNPGPAP